MALVTMITPIIPHTAEEVYQHLPYHLEKSVYLCDMPQAIIYPNSAALLEKYAGFMSLRDDVLKALETARNEKVIGKSMVANVEMVPTDAIKKLMGTLNVNFAQVFIVSNFKVVDTLEDGQEYPSGKIKVSLATGVTCSRCWQVVDHIDEDELCDRCHKIVKE